MVIKIALVTQYKAIIEGDVLSFLIQISTQSTSLSSWRISGFCLRNRIIVASITVELNAMKSVPTKRNYKMNGKRARKNIPPFRLITSIKSHTQVEDNEEWECKNEKWKKKKKETFYSGVSGFMTNLSGPVHAFKYVMNIKMRYITAPFTTATLAWGIKLWFWNISLPIEVELFLKICGVEW